MKKIIFAIGCLLLAGLLQGCIAAGALVVGGVAGGAIAADSRSFQNMSEDHKIVYNINQKVQANNDLITKGHVVVVSYNRVVLLVGQVPTPELSSQVEQMAHDAPNVRRVFNKMTIGAATSMSRRSKDSGITANVKARLVGTTNVSARQVKVTTEDGIVYLMGIMPRDHAAVAAEVARNSTGVKGVVKLIEYSNT